MKVAFPLGLNASLWLLVSSIRRFVEGPDRPEEYRLPGSALKAELQKIAVCISAHNEEGGIGQTIDSITSSVPAEHICIASDGSVDETAAVARQKGCQVVEFTPGRGKALAIKSLLERFQLFDRFEYILIADADTKFCPDFFVNAVSRFAQDEKLQVITAKVITYLQKGQPLSIKTYFLAYRIRLWQALEWVFIYGQTWKHTNISPVIPGYASIYRSGALRQLHIQVPGLAIEDFSLAFEFHKKRLGRIGYYTSIWAESQDPDNFTDYWNQLMRWNVGFFQTIKKWKVWPSFFWLFLAIYIFDNVLVASFLLLVPTFLTIFVLTQLGNVHEPHLNTFVFVFSLSLLVMFTVDYLFTLLVAWKRHEWRLVLHGPFFFVLHYINSVILFLAIPRAFLTMSDGTWSHPHRWKEKEAAKT